jgi:hypothetical protein
VTDSRLTQAQIAANDACAHIADVQDELELLDPKFDVLEEARKAFELGAIKLLEAQS